MIRSVEKQFKKVCYGTKDKLNCFQMTRMVSSFFFKTIPNLPWLEIPYSRRGGEVASAMMRRILFEEGEEG